MNKHKIFVVSPTMGTILPFHSIELSITARLDDIDVAFCGFLELFIENTIVSPYRIDLKAISIGNTVTTEPEIPASLDLGQQFLNNTYKRGFTVRNCGKRQQRLKWEIENVSWRPGQKVPYCDL